MANESSSMQWKFGLRHSSGKYLTAEAFGFKLNASGLALRQKQTFRLEQDVATGKVAIKTYLNRYISSRKSGEVTANAETRTEEEYFSIIALPDGRWVLQGCYGYYFGGSQDSLHCFAREYGETEKWQMHFAIHPLIALRNVNRKRFIRQVNNQLEATEDIAWMHESLVLLQFSDGKYMLRAPNGKYLRKDGTLVDAAGDDCKYIMEFLEGYVAFKASDGSAWRRAAMPWHAPICRACVRVHDTRPRPRAEYLQGYGANGVMCAKKTNITRDEMWELVDTHPQLTLKAAGGKFVSNRQTVEVKANQADVTDAEVFQFEFCDGKWALSTKKRQYLSIGDGGVLMASATNHSNETALFELTFDNDVVSLKASNGKYLSVKPNGQIAALADSISDREKFVGTVINRYVCACGVPCRHRDRGG